LVRSHIIPKMRLVLLFSFAFVAFSFADILVVPKSDSLDGKIHAVMDIDRDPAISPEWKGDSYPQIEITEKKTGLVLASIAYFGSVSDDARPLREHVQVNWRPDSKAFGITITDRFYSSCQVYVLNKEGQFVSPPSLFHDYEKMTGFPVPDVEHLRPRGRDEIIGWDKEGRLIYRIFRSPLPTFQGEDPLKHLVYLEVAPKKITLKKIEHEEGEWKNGDWISDMDKEAAPVVDLKFKGNEKPKQLVSWCPFPWSSWLLLYRPISSGGVVRFVSVS